MIEYMDVYDAQRRPTGDVVERGAHLGDGRYVLYSIAVVQDAQGRILITQRSAEKSWAPGAWEVQGGGVGAGQTSEESVRREIMEEVGLPADRVAAAPAELLSSYRNDDPDGVYNYFTDIYRITLDFTEADVRLQHSEAVDFRLATWEDVEDLNQMGTFLHFSRLKRALVGE